MNGRLMFLVTVIGRVISQSVSERRLGSHDSYSYGTDPSNPHDLANWHKTYPTCNGLEQSPIDIQTDHVRYVRHKCPKVKSSNRSIQGTLKNTGHTVEFKPNSHGTIKLKYVPHLPGVFFFHKVHMHYGGTRLRNKIYVNRTASTLHPGSEHTINGQRFDGEVHLVFYNSKYGNASEAMQHKDGLAVIATFVKIVPDDKLGDKRFTTFLEHNLPLVFAKKSKVNTDIDVSKFLDNSCTLYTYHGSLTTPLCNEVVTWIVLRNHIEVTFRAWTRFVFVESSDGYNELYGNYRPTMPVRGRTIETNFLQADMPKTDTFKPYTLKPTTSKPDTPNPSTPKPNTPKSSTPELHTPKPRQGRYRRPHIKDKRKHVPRMDTMRLFARFPTDFNPGPFQKRARIQRPRKGSYRYSTSQKGRSTDSQPHLIQVVSQYPDPRGRSYRRDVPQADLSTTHHQKISNPKPDQSRGRSQRRSQRKMAYPKDISQTGRSPRRRKPSKRISQDQYKDRQTSDRRKVHTKRRPYSYTKGAPEAVSTRRQTSFRRTRADDPYRTNQVRRRNPFGPLMSTYDQLYYDDIISSSYMPFDSVANMADYSPQNTALGSMNSFNIQEYMNAITEHSVA